MNTVNSSAAFLLAIVIEAGLVGAATAAPGSSAVTVTKSGSGSGTVTSNVGAIDCGMACSDMYSNGTPVILTATPPAGSQFTGWLGPCTGTGTCQFTVNAPTTVSATFATNSVGTPRLDFDGVSSCDALTDGMLAIRHLFGLSGEALIAGVVGEGAPRSTAMQIGDYLTDVHPVLDIDGDGQADVFTDGVLLMRYLFGLRGDSLIADAVGTGASRTMAGDIESQIQNLCLPATAIHTLTVNVAGTGSVSSADGKIAACTAGGGTCSANYASGSTAVMTATTTNGSNAFFMDWNAPSCDGPVKTCSEAMNADKIVGATFSAMANNLIFASSRTYAGGSAIGSVANADSECNAMATAAGINNAAATGFIAWISSSASNVFSRLGATARGWVRIDGKPVFDSQAEIQAHQIWHPINRDELGQLVTTNRFAATGTAANGTTASNTCQDWTAGAGQFGNFGSLDNGPSVWTAENNFTCGLTLRLYCMGKTKTVILNPAPFAGAAKYAFVSNATVAPNAVAGSAEFDAVCEAEKPAGSGTFKAMVAATGSTAASVLNATTNYVTIERQLIGTGAQIAAGSFIATGAGMWEHSNLSFPAGLDRVYTGSASPTAVASNAENCTDWGSTSGNGIFGFYILSDGRGWNFNSQTCTTPAHVHCIEQ